MVLILSLSSNWHIYVFDPSQLDIDSPFAVGIGGELRHSLASVEFFCFFGRESDYNLACWKVFADSHDSPFAASPPLGSLASLNPLNITHQDFVFASFESLG